MGRAGSAAPRSLPRISERRRCLGRRDAAASLHANPRRRRAPSRILGLGAASDLCRSTRPYAAFVRCRGAPATIAIAQMNPSNSRPTATTAFWWKLPPLDETVVSLVQPLLRRPCDRTCCRRRLALALAQRVGDDRLVPVVPTRLDDRAAQVGVAALRHRAAPRVRAAAVLRGNHPGARHQLARRSKSPDVANLGDDRRHRDELDGSHRLQRGNNSGVIARRHTRFDLGLEPRHAPLRFLDVLPNTPRGRLAARRDRAVSAPTTASTASSTD